MFVICMKDFFYDFKCLLLYLQYDSLYIMIEDMKLVICIFIANRYNTTYNNLHKFYEQNKATLKNL